MRQLLGSDAEKMSPGSQDGDRPGGSSISHSVLIRGHTSFPDEPEAHPTEVQPETPTHSSEEAQ